jgi:predicted nucleotidyltransferase component of viral defense system
MLDPRALTAEAEASGFGLEPLEKAARLLELTDALCRHPFLGERIVLKGGTALNLFVLDLPRLSVDIDLNYVGAVERAAMLVERPKVEQAIHAVCGRLGIEVRRVPSEHAGGKWRLGFASVTGTGGTLELDVNFLLRTPLWPPVLASSRAVAGVRAVAVPVLEIHELTAGKLAALFDRAAARDLFDARNLLRDPRLDRERLRVALLVYAGASRRDWRGVSLDAIQADPDDIDRRLLPVLHAGVAPPRAEVAAWTRRLVEECRALVGELLPLGGNEVEFLERLNQRGEIAGEFLTDDERLRGIIRVHPGLLWKAWNVRRHRGLEAARDSNGNEGQTAR